MEYTQEQLAEIYRKLPKDLKDAISRVDTLAATKNIGDKYKLHVDQLGNLADEIGLVVFGVHQLPDFTKRIQGKLTIGQTTAESITRDVNNSIFLPIRESLRRVQEENGGEEAAPANPAGPEKPNEAKPDIEKDRGIFDEKMAKMFNLPKEQVDLQIPGVPVDPYLEKPE